MMSLTYIKRKEELRKMSDLHKCPFYHFGEFFLPSRVTIYWDYTVEQNFGLFSPQPTKLQWMFWLGLSEIVEFFSFWKNTRTPQPDRNVNFGPNECSSHGGTNQGLCVIHGMCVVDFFHIYIFSKWCSHMPTQVGACTLILGCKFVNTISMCLLSSPWALKYHLMLRGWKVWLLFCL